MNVLLISPAIPQTFWSLDRALRMVGAKAENPPLGLLTLAALLPPEWKLRVVNQIYQTLSDQAWADCDLVMISGQAVQANGILANIREAKRRGKYVVVGGPWVFHCPEEVIQKGADIVVVGEAEVVMDRLLDAIQRRATGLIITAERLADMAQSPLPRYDLIHVRDYTTMSLQFTRGCPFNCDFCDVTLMLGRQVRHKTPAQILRELQCFYDSGFRGFVLFVDDNFIGNIKATKALLKELIPWMQKRKYPFHFSTQASVNMAKDDELLHDMFVAGFRGVFLGIETQDVESLKAARKHQNVVSDLDEACRKINRAGFQIIAGVILGFDHEKPAAGQRLLDFAIRNNIPELFVTLLQAVPGTDLHQRLGKENRLLPINHEFMSNQTALPNFIPTRPIPELADEYLNLYRTLYDPAAYTKRVYQHLLSMAPPKINLPFAWPTWQEARAVYTLFLRQGFFYSSRWTFWSCFFKALWNYPERVDRFITACVLEEHYREFRGIIVRKIERQLALLSPAERARCYTLLAAKQS